MQNGKKLLLLFLLMLSAQGMEYFQKMGGEGQFTDLSSPMLSLIEVPIQQAFKKNYFCKFAKFKESSLSSTMVFISKIMLLLKVVQEF